ncbi:MAG: hypothetical protein IKH46_10935 [Lachnospiraceae bacterium]|nr:hypothetical protein [Lachnospiraceae bacterium]
MRSGYLRKIGICGVLAAATLTMLLSPLDSDAAAVVTTGVVDNNIHDNDYTQYKPVTQCYLCNNGDGTLSRIENFGDIVMVEYFDGAYNVIGHKFLKMELPKFGGCWCGAKYNYVIFGQDNPEKKDDVECIRVVQYNKNWDRVGALSIKNCYTKIPFDECNTDMTEYGDELYIRMGHRTYDDRQATMTIAMRQSNRSLIQAQANVAPGSGAYGDVVATFIDSSDEKIVTVDHSLNYPRGINASRYDVKAGTGNFVTSVKKAEVMSLSGDLNTYSPYTAVSGLEVSGQYDLIVGRTTPGGANSGSYNVFIAAVPKNNFDTKAVKLAFPTGYAYGDTYTVSAPFIVKVSGEQFVVLWEVYQGAGELERVDYVYVDGSGQMTSQVQTMQGCLSDCQPVVYNGQVVWYTGNGSKMTMYSVPATGGVPYASQQVTTAKVAGSIDYSAVYDFAYYVNRYPDVRVLYQNDPEGALWHFIHCGMPEGRQGSDNFDPQVYYNKNADLRASFGADWTAYYMHFINYGAAEGRRARTEKK